MERTNAMHVRLPEPVELITIDVGWTRQRNILPNAARLLAPGGAVVTLVKPHYEADPSLLRKGILPEQNVDEILQSVKAEAEQAGWIWMSSVRSPIRGAGGNVEVLARLRAPRLKYSHAPSIFSLRNDCPLWYRRPGFGRPCSGRASRGCLRDPTRQALLAGRSPFDRSWLACLLEKPRRRRTPDTRQTYPARRLHRRSPRIPNPQPIRTTRQYRCLRLREFCRASGKGDPSSQSSLQFSGTVPGGRHLAGLFGHLHSRQGRPRSNSWHVAAIFARQSGIIRRLDRSASQQIDGKPEDQR